MVCENRSLMLSGAGTTAYVERRGHNCSHRHRLLASLLGSHLAGLLSVQRVSRITAEDESW